MSRTVLPPTGMRPSNGKVMVPSESTLNGPLRSASLNTLMLSTSAGPIT